MFNLDYCSFSCSSMRYNADQRRFISETSTRFFSQVLRYDLDDYPIETISSLRKACLRMLSIKMKNGEFPNISDFWNISFSRADFALDLPISDPTNRTALLELANKVPFLSSKSSTITDEQGLRTDYFGTRGKPVFLRIYDKPSDGVYRFEVEVRSFVPKYVKSLDAFFYSVTGQEGLMSRFAKAWAATSNSSKELPQGFVTIIPVYNKTFIHSAVNFLSDFEDHFTKDKKWWLLLALHNKCLDNQVTLEYATHTIETKFGSKNPSLLALWRNVLKKT